MREARQAHPCVHDRELQGRRALLPGDERDEIEAAAKRSPSYGKAVSPWKSDYEAMAKKTVIRRAFPYLPVSVEARDAAASDDQTPDYSDVFRPLPTVTADDSPVDVSVDEPRNRNSRSRLPSRRSVLR